VGTDSRKDRFRSRSDTSVSALLTSTGFSQSADTGDVYSELYNYGENPTPLVPPPIAYSIKSLCTAVDLSRSLVYQHIKANLLKTLKVGRRTIVLREDAEAWLQSMRVEKRGDSKPTGDARNLLSPLSTDTTTSGPESHPTRKTNDHPARIRKRVGREPP
jgi:hypothetical protein